MRGDEQFQTFNLVTPLTITSGSFAVGAIDDFGIADLPALYVTPGKSNPPGTESFITPNNGALWRKMPDAILPDPFCGPGSLLVRATVELGQIEAPALTKIRDSQAVEPWGVAAASARVFVTNFVSDNVTVINSANNSFQNVPLTDPRVCPACGGPLGPFGVAAESDDSVFVTLFGANTIPSKEFPIDYSTVGAGRVIQLKLQSDGTYKQTGIITVGKGPMFPALALTRIGSRKLYVPCAGANRVDVINPITLQKIAEIPVGREPSSCTASATSPKLYVTNFGDGSISVIDTATDRVTKTIPAPKIILPQSISQVGAPPQEPPTAASPWSAAVSQTNGNLYVAYWGTVGNREPNGAIIEFDTCKDEVLRAIIDDTTRGTPPGSAGASGIPAPTAALARDAMGVTPGAGGGGGGPFGIASCSLRMTRPGVLPMLPNQAPLLEPTIAFTNDASGIIAAIDARIDQVVTAPPFAVASCPKPRGVACLLVRTGNQVKEVIYAACGQPDNSVLAITIPQLTRENLPGLPAIESASAEGNPRIRASSAFDNRTRVEIIDTATGACLKFVRPPKFKKGNTVLLQKGSLTDDRRPSDLQFPILRLVAPDGTVRLFYSSEPLPGGASQ